jgi:carboxypeptidase PM20D1
MRRVLLRSLAALGIAVLILAAGLAAVAWRSTPSEIAAPPAAPAEIDVAAAAARLGEAIRFQTIAKIPGEPLDPEIFRNLHTFLERRYPAVHAALPRRVVGGYSLLYRWEGTDASLKPMLLMGHMDVVPALGKWTQPPFSGAVADGFIWGRGALDDKVSVLGILEAAEHLLREGFRPRRTVYLAFGHDEEIEGRNGARRIVAQLQQDGVRLELVLDEGSPIVTGVVPGIKRPVALIGTAEKGYLSVELIARTSGGHSSMPSLHSAIMVMGRAFQRLRTDAPPLELRPPMSQTLDALAPHFSFVPRLVIANRWLTEPLLLREFGGIPETSAMVRTTTAVTVVRAGEKDNVLPGEARAIMNLRLLPGDTVAATLAAMRATLADSGVEVRQYGDAFDPSPVSDVGSDSYRRLAVTVRQVFPDAIVVPALVIAATDSRHYVAIADNVYRFLPTRLEPADMGRMHGRDERVSIENYGEIIRFYAQFLRNAAQ